MRSPILIQSGLRFLFQGFLASMLLVLALQVNAQTNGDLTSAEFQGHKLASDLCGSIPAESMTNSGVLTIRRAESGRTKISIQFEIIATSPNWQAIYKAKIPGSSTDDISKDKTRYSELKIIHAEGQPNRYLISDAVPKSSGAGDFHPLTGDQLLKSFAGSDFWLCDLGLQFFHWPDQKVLPNPTHLKRGRSYTLLESTNPNPSPDGYSRVLSWIDKETGGILEAQAFDAKGQLFKVFEPKSFKKVDGQWELQEMEIRNVQTDSSTRIEFDLDKN